MSNPILGTAFVLVRADTSAFSRELSTQVDAAVAGVSKSAGSLGGLAAIGGEAFKVIGTGFAVIGAASVEAAVKFQDSHAKLVQAVKDTGLQFAPLKDGVDIVDKHFEHLGFTFAQTQDALGQLTIITKSPQQALADLGLAADIAAGRHIDLNTATIALGRALEGNLQSFVRLGIITKEQSLNIHNQAQLIEALQAAYGGQAAAAADTFGGKMRALSATARDFGVVIGNALIPEIEAVGTTLTGAVGYFEKNQAAAIALAAAVGGPLVLAMGAYVVSVGAAAAARLADVWTSLVGVAGTLGRGIGLLGAANIEEAATAATAAASTGTLDAALVALNALLTSIDLNLTVLVEHLGAAAGAEVAMTAATGELDAAIVVTEGLLGGGLAAAALSAGLALATLVGVVGGVNQEFKDLKSGNWSNIFVDLASMGVVPAIKGVVQLGHDLTDFVGVTHSASSATQDFSGTLNANVAELNMVSAAAKNAAQGYDSYIASLNGSVVGAAQANAAIGKQTDHGKAAFAAITTLESAQDALTKATTGGASAAKASGDAALHLREVEQQLADVRNVSGAYLQSLTSAELGLGHARENQITTAEALAAAQKVVNDVINNSGVYAQQLAGAQNTAASSALALQAAQQALTVVQTTYNQALTDSGLYLEQQTKDELALQSAQLGQLDAANALVAAQNALKNLQSSTQAATNTLSSAGGNIALAKELASIQGGDAKQNALALALAQENLQKAQIQVQQSSFTVIDAQKTLNDLTAQAIPGTQQYQQLQLQLQQAQQAVTDATKSASDAQTALQSVVNQSIPGTVEYAKNQDALVNAQLAVKDATNQTSTAQTAYQLLLDQNIPGTLAYAKNQQLLADAIAAVAAAQAGVASNVNATNDALAKQAKAYADLTTQAQALSDAGMLTQLIALVQAVTAGSIAQAILLPFLAAAKQNAGVVPLGGPGHNTAHAFGGPATGSFLAGEQGPEVVNIGSASGSVTPANAVANFSGSSAASLSNLEQLSQQQNNTLLAILNNAKPSNAGVTVQSGAVQQNFTFAAGTDPQLINSVMVQAGQQTEQALSAFASQLLADLEAH